MPIEVIKRDIELKCKPKNGTEAYGRLIEAINHEIGELQVILQGLSELDAKKRIIEDWNQNVSTVSVWINEGA